MLHINKYNAKKTVINNIKFDSKTEAEYYIYLKELQNKGIVNNIELQPSFILQNSFKKNGKTFRAIKYKADFKVTYSDSEIAIIDIKGMETDVFKIKRKIFEYSYPKLNLTIIKKKNGEWLKL